MAESTKSLNDEELKSSNDDPTQHSSTSNGDDEKPPEDIESGTKSEAVADATEEDTGGGKSDNDEGMKTKIDDAGESPETRSREGNQIQSMEIDVNGADEGNETDESFEDDGDMQHLLRGTKNDGSDNAPQKESFSLCTRPKRVGNMWIFLPSTFYKTGWGIAGPHWFGPFCVMFIIGLASHYFIGISMRRIGPITTTICILFTAACAYNLANVAYRDPGVVKLQPTSARPETADEDQRLQYRWCDRCQVFQPVDGAHCSDCNVCIAGFDHHCVWTGTCIGKNNFKQFVKFNITWLLYLIFSVTWVSVLGPLIFGRHHKEANDVPDSHPEDGT